MVREILRGVLTTVVIGFDRGQSVAIGVLMIGGLVVGCTAYFGTLFAVVAVYALLGSPSGLTALAAVLAFVGSFPVACLAVVAAVRFVFRYRPTEARTKPSAPKPPRRSRTEVLSDVAALDRRLAAPVDPAAHDETRAEDTART